MSNLTNICLNNKNMKKLIFKIANLLSKIFLLFPLSNIIIFESNPDFNDEGYWLCKLMLDKGYDKKYKFVWLISDRNSKIPDGWNVIKCYRRIHNLFEWIKKQYVLHTAKYIFDNCDFVYKKRKRQFRVYFIHGMIFKNCDHYFSHLGEVDLISIGSKYYYEYFEKFGIIRDHMMTYGLVRNDILKSKTVDVRNILKINKGIKVALWMPTYRQHIYGIDVGCSIPRMQGDETGFPVLRKNRDFKEMNAILSACNTMLIIKPHPSQNLDNLYMQDYSNIIFFTNNTLRENNIQLYEILRSTDALLTDYSSIYFDYLLLNKPVGLVIDDFELYKQNVGFINDFKSQIEATYIEDKKSLFNFINNLANNPNILIEDLGDAKDRFHTVKDYTSGELILKRIKNETGL